MDQALKNRLVGELQALAAADSTAMAETELFKNVADYLDPDLAQREIDTLFRTLPTAVGHQTQIPEPGDYFTTDLAGTPLLVVRQDDGSIEAHLNVCRHRGARVVEEATGSKRTFTCPYHAWTYGRQGDLVATPEQQGFCGVDLSDRGLVSVLTEVRHGMIWVQLEGDSIDVAAHLGPLDEELFGYGLASWHEERVDEIEVDLNWKFIIDGFLELYHLPFLHAETVGGFIKMKPATFDALADHSRLVGVRRSFDGDLLTADPDTVDLLPHTVIIHNVFPNTIIVWQGGHFEIWSIVPHPTDARRSRARASLLTPSAQDAVDRADFWDKNWKLLMDTVQHEDYRVARGIQANVTSGAQQQVVFGRNEPALQHFHRTLATRLAT